MTSGRPAIMASALPGAERSAATVSTFPANPTGWDGATTSTSVSLSINLPLSAWSRASRSTSLRPTIPAAPMISISTQLLLDVVKSRLLISDFCSLNSKREAAIDQMDVPGGEARFVGREIDRQHGDLMRRAEAAHRLAIDEAAAHRGQRLPGRLRERGDALVERGRLDRARADGVGANTTLDEIRRDRLGKPDHRRLGGAVDVTVRQATHRGSAGRDVDDRALFLFEHRRQGGLGRAMHRFDVEVEGEVPVGFRASERRAVLDGA